MNQTEALNDGPKNGRSRVTTAADDRRIRNLNLRDGSCTASSYTQHAESIEESEIKCQNLQHPLPPARSSSGQRLELSASDGYKKVTHITKTASPE